MTHPLSTRALADRAAFGTDEPDHHHVAAAYADPEPIPCALCPAVVERLDAHWHEELGDEVCEDCCHDCTKEND